MSNSNDQSINNLINAIDDMTNGCFSPLTEDFLAQFTSEFSQDQDYASVVNTVFSPLNAPMQSPPGFSPANNSTYQELSNVVSQAVALPVNTQINPTSLEIIAQPYYGSKLRYRSDYENNENRLGVLKNRTKNSSYQGPAIRIPPCYLNPNDGYSIRVSLVTTKYDKTGLHYLHPYELEHPTNENLNDRQNNAVWFPIQIEDCSTGIKSFRELRIVKKRASDMKDYGNLRIFDCQNTNFQGNSLRQLASVKDTINEYNLDRSQLVFTVGKRVINNSTHQTLTDLCPTTTVFSEEMIEGAGKETDLDNDIQSPNEKTVTSPSLCRVYKYAPKYGFEQSEEDMVIFLTSKPEPKKYGELKVTFQCNILGRPWSKLITDLDVKDRMISFKTPMFPYPFNETAAVDVIIQQDNRFIDTIKYFYLAILSNCSSCQLNGIRNGTDVVPNVPVKRPIHGLGNIDFNRHDGEVPDLKSPPESEQLLLESEQLVLESLQQPSSSTSTSNSTSIPSNQLPATTTDTDDAVMNKLANSIESIFLNNDYDAFFRICRSFLKNSPQLIHTALDNNYMDLLLKFIPTSLNVILQQKNSRGETVLLHALRLNRLEIIQAILKKDKSDVLLEAIDGKDNNIFHIIALNSIPLETINFLIDHFVKNSINIAKKFDRFNQDHWTPLQLSISKNNLLATKSFLKYFQTNIYQNLTGDNLLHLAVRYGNLSMVQYLIENGQLINQVKQSNLQMTPKDLAQSLQRHDMVEYFNEIFPPQEIDENDSSDGDDD